MRALQSQNTQHVKTKHSNSEALAQLPLSDNRCIMCIVREQSVTLGEIRCHADAMTGQMPKLIDVRPSVIRSSQLNRYAS